MAETLWPYGLKKTKQRAEVLDALCEAGRPVSAREISLILERRESFLWISTVYRVLKTFLEHDIIQQAAVHENGMAVYELNDGHRHYAVCNSCRNVITVSGCPLEGIAPDLEDKGFHVLGHKLQISGYCGDCYDKISGAEAD